MQLEDILKALQSGQQPTKEQTDFLVTSLSKVLAGKKPDGASDTGMGLADFQNGLMSALDAVRNSPEGQKNLQETIAERKTQRFTKRYTPFFNAILAGADIATSLKQVKNSTTALRNLATPALPAVPGADPLLDQTIAGAQRGTMDAARAAGPARQELQDQYAQDIALAKNIGGGQSATLGALGQVASMRRARGAANLVPLVDNIRAREQGRLDSLLNTRLQQQQQNFYNRSTNAHTLFDQYNNNVLAAGNLGSVGRLNLRNSMGALLNATPGVLARTGGGFNDKYSQYENQINQSLVRPMNSNPYSAYTADDSIGVNGNLY